MYHQPKPHINYLCDWTDSKDNYGSQIYHKIQTACKPCHIISSVCNEGH